MIPGRRREDGDSSRRAERKAGRVLTSQHFRGSGVKARGPCRSDSGPSSTDTASSSSHALSLDLPRRGPASDAARASGFRESVPGDPDRFQGLSALAWRAPCAHRHRSYPVASHSRPFSPSSRVRPADAGRCQLPRRQRPPRRLRIGSATGTSRAGSRPGERMWRAARAPSRRSDRVSKTERSARA
jgi:hypothetical protein